MSYSEISSSRNWVDSDPINWAGQLSQKCRFADMFLRIYLKRSRNAFGEGNGTPFQCSCLENPMDGGAWWAVVHGVARVGHDWATSLSLFTHTLEKEMATHSSVLAWIIPWTEEPGRLQPVGSQRVRLDWATEQARMYCWKVKLNKYFNVYYDYQTYGSHFIAC